MRAARIRVFDGLRIATEHVEHLQDSVHSSIEELREAVGLPRIVRGLAVRADGDDAIVVETGLAFDARRRRLAVDEPLRVEVAPAPGVATRYVCLGHEGVEDGEVEGRPTLVWDSVTVALRDAPPTDDFLALARLVQGEGDTFTVGPLEEPEPPAEEPAGAPAGPQPAPLRVAVGVARLPGDAPEAADPFTALLAALREPAEGSPPVRVPLAATDVALEFPPASVGLTVRLSATVQGPDGGSVTTEGAGHGEVALGDGAKFGLLTLRRADEDAGSQLAQDAVAALPLRASLRLLADVHPAPPAGFGLACALVWGGPRDEAQLAALEAELMGLTWELVAGWRAIGAAAPARSGRTEEGTNGHEDG